jgi:urease accessory protein
LLDTETPPLTPPKLQRAIGKLTISASHDPARGSQLKDLRQQGSFRVIFPRSPDTSVHAVMINTAGGVTGGDHFEIRGAAHKSATLTLTTQAAERIYGAVGSEPGQIDTHLTVEAGACLNWLPQETILFDACNLNRRLNVELAKDAQFLMVEPLVFGREASGETVQRGTLTDHVSITRVGKPIYFDRIHLDGDIAAEIKSPALCGDARAMASIVLCAPDAMRHLDAVRALLPDTAGASLLQNDILVIRLLATGSFELRRALLPILTLLTDDTVPKNWRL